VDKRDIGFTIIEPTYIIHSRKINSALITLKMLSTATIHPIALNERNIE